MNALRVREEVVAFECEGECLLGVLAQPAAPCAEPHVGVLIVVGGPQYRVGSHRQFVLLARAMADAGFPVLRFDHRGIGDSEGAMRSFEDIGPDITVALEAMCAACPNLAGIVVWGLCDAASAALMHATANPKVAGLVLANPWSRGATSLAATQIRHYYARRVLQRQFWSKALRGDVRLVPALLAFCAAVRRAWLPGRRVERLEERPFHDRMAAGLAGFPGPVLLFLSGDDLTAREFLHHAASTPAWRGALDRERVRRIELPEADHTFSRAVWLDAVCRETVAWLKQMSAAAPVPVEKLERGQPA